MRITQNQIFTQLNQALDNTYTTYNKLNVELATQKKINAPSDDVNGTVRAMAYTMDIGNNNQYMQNINLAITSLQLNSNNLAQVESTISQALQLAQTAGNGITDPEVLASDTQQANNLRDQLLSLGNSKLMGQYVFAGFKSYTQPYSNSIPVPTQASVGNSNGANITSATITNSNTFNGDQWKIVYDAIGNQYTATDQTTPATPAVSVAYNPLGTSVNFGGMSVGISGTPANNDTFVINSIPTVNSNPAGITVNAATVTNPAALTGAQYKISFDGAGNYSVYNNQTNSIVQQPTAIATPLTLPGMSISLAGGPASAGDTIIVSPPPMSYDYQGDNNNLKIPIDNGATLQSNITGNDAFSYKLGADTVQQLDDGKYVHYTPGAGTTINVEIRDTNDTTVTDTFSFSNVMQMTNLLSSAIGANNTDRVKALIEPFTQMQTQIQATESEVGTRVNRLQNQSSLLTQNNDSEQTALSSATDADTVTLAAELQQTLVTLTALKQSAGQVLSQTLFDFLK